MTSAQPYQTRSRKKLLRAVRVPHVAVAWFCAALAVRILAALAIHIYSERSGFGGFYPLISGHDDHFYYDTATLVSQGYYVGELPSAYPLLLGALFAFTGPNLLLGKLVNVLAGAISVYLGVLLVKTLADSRAGDEPTLQSRRASLRAAHWTGFFLTFYPSAVWYSTQLLKDPILIAAGLWALYLEVRFLRKPGLLYAALWVLAFFILFLFRSYAALILGFSLLLFTLRYRRVWLIPVFVLIAVGPYALGWGLFAWNFIDPWLNAEHLASFREGVYSTGGSAAGIQVDFSNPITFLMTYTYSFATVMFGPFPWQITAGSQLIALVEAAAIWPLIPIWWKGIAQLFRGKHSHKPQIGTDALILIFSVVLAAAVALFSDNIGANTRLRLLPWCAFMIYAAPHIRFRLRHFGRATRRHDQAVYITSERTTADIAHIPL